MKTGFIYIWYDRKRKMFYIGCHVGTENDGYICSSRRMRDVYRRRPEDFKRRILKRNIPREDLLEEEHKWLQLIKDEELGKKYYNHSKRHFGHWSKCPEKVKNMSERNKGKNNPMYGKGYLLKGKKKSEETIRKIKEKRKFQIHNDETKKKISESHMGEKNHFFGKTHSEKTKKIMSDIAKNRKKIKCECGKLVTLQLKNKYHKECKNLSNWNN